jgi:hypothetical protein
MLISFAFAAASPGHEKTNSIWLLVQQATLPQNYLYLKIRQRPLTRPLYKVSDTKMSPPQAIKNSRKITYKSHYKKTNTTAEQKR